MTELEETVARIAEAETWDERVARVRQIPQRHGTDEHPAIYAQAARLVYVPHLAPDYAYVHSTAFYEIVHFEDAYRQADDATAGFTLVDVTTLASAIRDKPMVLLPLRVITGLGRNEFAASTALVAPTLDLQPLTANKVDSMERSGTSTTEAQARVAAETIVRIMDGTLFGEPVGDLRSKQNKPDTEAGWTSVQQFAAGGVPYSMFLHQRHYGGAFRQVLDATSEQRGNLIEDAVEDLFTTAGISFIRTGSHNQAEIADRFEVTIKPAPDFVVYDSAGVLRAMLECKGANDGGTARDKALRFERLRDESLRLGGIPLIAVLSGLGWARVNDTLGPVVRDTDGRVFTLATLPEMLTLSPFPSLLG